MIRLSLWDCTSWIRTITHDHVVGSHDTCATALPGLATKHTSTEESLRGRIHVKIWKIDQE